MKKYLLQTVLLLTLIGIGFEPLHASKVSEGLELVNYGEDAITYAAGSIAESYPRVGLVSNVTGDNQTTGNKRLLGRDDIIYVNFDEPDQVSKGDVFTVYRYIHEVIHPQDGRYLGNLFNIVGVVEVMEAGENPATVRVRRSYASVFPGDRIMPFIPPVPLVPEPGSELIKTEGMEGMIIDVPPARTLIAQNQVVYIDWGAREGLLSGDRLEVFRDSEGLPRRVIGELKVLGVGEHTSSALIFQSKYPFLRGDRFTFKKGTNTGPLLVEKMEEGEEELSMEDDEMEDDEMMEEAQPIPLMEFVQEGDHETLVVGGLLDHVEFDSGEARIRPEGEEILQQVSLALKDISGKYIRVEGHTDDVEIGPTLKKAFPTNWELSSARAKAVVQWLKKKGALPSSGYSQMGYAASLPKASNGSEKGRQLNRRVEIVLYPSDPTKRELEEKPYFDKVQSQEEALHVITSPSQPPGSESAPDPTSENPEDFESSMEPASETSQSMEHEQPVEQGDVASIRDSSSEGVDFAPGEGNPSMAPSDSSETSPRASDASEPEPVPSK